MFLTFTCCKRRQYYEVYGSKLNFSSSVIYVGLCCHENQSLAVDMPNINARDQMKRRTDKGPKKEP